MLKALRNPFQGEVCERFAEAERELLDMLQANTWFTESYWPTNRPRLVEMVRAAVRAASPDPSVEVIDVGCGIGYMSYVFARLGYTVTGLDGYPDPSRDEMFGRVGARYLETNFNEPEPLAVVPDDGYRIVLCGEVLEHILDYPQGFVNELFRVASHGGYAIVTTPNPATIMNAYRLLAGRYSLWGTAAFVSTRKVSDGQIISRGDIHYREYLAHELLDQLRVAGFQVYSHCYLGAGPDPGESVVKRFVKRTPFLRRLSQTRLFGAGQCAVGFKA